MYILMEQSGGKSCYNSNCNVGMLLVRQDFPLGSPLVPVSIRGAKISHYGIFGLIKVWIISTTTKRSKFVFLNVMSKFTYYFSGNRTEEMEIGGCNLVIRQKKLDFGRRVGFIKALEISSSGVEKYTAHHCRVLKWDMDIFLLRIWDTMRIWNVYPYWTVLITLTAEWNIWKSSRTTLGAIKW